MSTRSGRSRQSVQELSPPRTRKGVSPPRSPARSKKSSPPTRSPSRRSPARRSPGRKPAARLPARKSPSRTTKEKEAPESKSPGKRAAIKNNVEVKLVDVSKLDSYKLRPKRTAEYSIKDLTPDAPEDYNEKTNGLDNSNNKDYGIRSRKAEEIIPRRSSRIKEFIDNEIRKSFSKSISKSVSQTIDTFSDDDTSEYELRKEKSKPITRRLATPLRDSVSKMVQISSRWEFGGWIGSSILILLIPLTVFTFLKSCLTSCSLNSVLDVSSFKNLSFWYNPQAIYLVTAQIIIQALFACLPVFGTKADKNDDTGKKYSFNAFFASIVTASILFSLDFFRIININTILNSYSQLATVSYAFAVVLAIVLYVKSRKLDESELNPYGITGFRVYDFFVGREIHPQLKMLDVKIWTSRICNITTLILAILIFRQGIYFPARLPAENLSIETYKEALSKVQLKPTVLVFSMMQILYILNFVMQEHKVTSTFYWNSEGLGYLQLVSSALYPFYFTSISKFVADNKVELSTSALIVSSGVFLIGFLIMLITNNIKHAFRQNPLDLKLSKLAAMPTFRGSSLLLGGGWGAARHPNHAAAALLHAALAVPGIASGQLAAAAPSVLTALQLAHRARRQGARCRRRYGAAWERYCQRVPAALLPKVL